MERINTCPACSNERLGVKTKVSAPHTCTTGTGERKAVIKHQTHTFCSNCDSDLTREEVRSNECWTCKQPLFNTPIDAKQPLTGTLNQE